MNGAMIKSEILRAVKHTLRMTAWRFAHPRRGGISVLPLPVILSEREGSGLPLLVILRSAATKDLGLEPGKTKSEILRAVKRTLRMTPKSSHSERSGGTKADLRTARDDCNTPNNQKGGIIP